MGHDADITAGREHAGRERAMDEIEVGFAGQFLAAERKLEAARLEIEGPVDAEVDLRVFPRASSR